MRIKTFIVQKLDKNTKVLSSDETTMVFLSVTREDVFQEVYPHLEGKVSGIAVDRYHHQNVYRLIRNAFDYKAQYFKVVDNNGPTPFLRSSNPIVYLKNSSWGVDMNLFRKAINKNKPKVKDPLIDLYLEKEYEDVGLVHDIACVLGSKIEIPHMELHDAQVYIARWGGQPGQERYKTPYGI